MLYSCVTLQYNFHSLSAIIESRGLTKRFGSFTAVSDLSFTIAPGDVYGFLGQNGAGKSTTMRMMLGLIHPDAGQVFIKGTAFTRTRRELLRYIGAIIERPDMYGYLTAWDNLRMFARLSKPGIPDKRLHEVLELVGLTGREKDKVKAYSQGMKQRLGIAVALVHDPELLILDEPTNGLDPQGIAEMRELIRHLSRDQGKTVLISSHLLHEIEQVATRMLIIHRGSKIKEGPVSELLNPDETLMEISFEPDSHTVSALQGSGWQPYIFETKPGQAVLKMNPVHTPELTRWLVAQGTQVLGLHARHSLEALFLTLTNDTAHTGRTV